mmetsp:Transcript_4696/g.7295  ORF Transcript_4696/g.7295 Transcript_4696/m.7295 type:complete len:389 (+) Transcript_4696:699-1865(+)
MPSLSSAVRFFINPFLHTDHGEGGQRSMEEYGNVLFALLASAKRGSGPDREIIDKIFEFMWDKSIADVADGLARDVLCYDSLSRLFNLQFEAGYDAAWNPVSGTSCENDWRFLQDLLEKMVSQEASLRRSARLIMSLALEIFEYDWRFRQDPANKVDKSNRPQIVQLLESATSEPSKVFEKMLEQIANIVTAKEKDYECILVADRLLDLAIKGSGSLKNVPLKMKWFVKRLKTLELQLDYLEKLPKKLRMECLEAILLDDYEHPKDTVWSKGKKREKGALCLAKIIDYHFHTDLEQGPRRQSVGKRDLQRIRAFQLMLLITYLQLKESTSSSEGDPTDDSSTPPEPQSEEADLSRLGQAVYDLKQKTPTANSGYLLVAFTTCSSLIDH